ncbi:MAG: polysaccharide deacetylase family protein [Pseudonocardia sp.]|nr:polysaccharide deacetylase family protein [Pseudonocardia sp.]
MLQGTRTRRRRIPPFRRRELPSVYLALLAFGLVVPLLPPLDMPDVPVTTPVLAPEPAPEPPPPVQVQLVAPGPVVPRAALLNKLADTHTIALTFDDGPDPRWTPKILATLRRHGAVATFCMVSKNAAGHEELVKQVVDAGMRLCDHSHTHDEQLPDRDPARIDDEVVGAQSTLSAAAGGASVKWFRAPGGNWSTEVTKLSVEHGMQPLSWNVDPRDWERPGAAAIVAAVQQQIRQQAPDGPIVLLHDGGGPRDQTVDALEQLIPWLAEQGYRFGFPVP